MINHKSVHFVVLLIVIIGVGALLHKHPEFYADSLTTFSTVGGVVTFYSLLFAVIELLRTKGVALHAKDEAIKAANRVESLYAIKDLSSCQSAVEMAIEAIDKNENIPSSTLCHITKVYSQVFHDDLSRVDTRHRKAKSVLDSYSFASRDQNSGKNSNKNKLKEALLAILEHLSSEVGKKTKDN